MSSHKTQIELQQCDISVAEGRGVLKGGYKEGWENSKEARWRGFLSLLWWRRLVRAVVWFLKFPPLGQAFFNFQSTHCGEK